jgi:hypothetical protein
MLIRTTEELKLFTKLNKNTSFESTSESLDLAEQKFLVPILDTPQYSDLIAGLNLNVLDVDEQKLLKLCRRVVANAGMYLAYPTLNISQSDLGIQQVKSREGTSEPANQWRYQGARSSYLTLTTQAIEELYAFLQENKNIFLLWRNGKGFSEYNESWIRNNKELGLHLNTADSVRAYIALKPFMSLAESKYITAIVPSDKITELKTAISGNTISLPQQVEIHRIQRALAWAAYFEAIPFISFEINTQSITVAMQMDDMSNKRPLSMEERKMLLKSAQANMEFFIKELTTYYAPVPTDTMTENRIPCNEHKPDFWI